MVCVCVCAAGEKNEVEFLQTTEGDQFQCIFSKVRYGSVVSDPQSVQTLDEDRIVPQSEPFDMGRRREGEGKEKGRRREGEGKEVVHLVR